MKTAEELYQKNKLFIYLKKNDKNYSMKNEYIKRLIKNK